jgi:hypothetical protein
MDNAESTVSATEYVGGVLIRTSPDKQSQMNQGIKGPLPATVRHSLRQAPRRKAAVHSRWCPLRATLGWIRDESAGAG